MRLNIITPQGKYLSTEISNIYLPGEIGKTGILKNHLPLISKLSDGELRFAKDDGSDKYFFIKGGYLRLENNEIFILTQFIKQAEELNIKEVEMVIDNMDQKIKDAKTGKTKPEELDALLREIKEWKTKRSIIKKSEK